MDFVLYQLDRKQLVTGERQPGGPYAHQGGGGGDLAGRVANPGRPPVHLLVRLDLRDPVVGFTLPGVSRLPLLCAIRYGACHLGYRVVADDRVEIVYQADAEPWAGFPSDDYPEVLPVEPIRLIDNGYDPDRPGHAWFYSGLFGTDHLTNAQRAALAKYVVEAGFYEMYRDSEEQTPEEFVAEQHGYPFLQGLPDERCPNPARPGHGKTRPRLFASFQEDGARARTLWGPHGENLQIIWLYCRRCHAFLATNQCT